MSAAHSTSVIVAPRPYIIDFGTPHGQYPLTSDDVERLAANYPIVRVRPSRLTLRADDGRNVEIYPATLGGGRAFEVES
jgi:hypothetical protein